MINLIPPDLAASGPTAKLALLIKNTGLVLFAVFVVSTLGMIGIFIYYKVSIQSALGQENQLKESVKSLETTEQKLVLIKDRLSYADTIFAKETSMPHVDKLNQILSGFPGVSLTRSEMAAGKNDVSFNISDIGTLESLLLGFKSGNYYKNVSLDSFSFTPGSGYQISLTLADKDE